MEYIPGKENKVADCLSRLRHHEDSLEGNDDYNKLLQDEKICVVTEEKANIYLEWDLETLLWDYKMKMSIMNYWDNYYEITRWRLVLWIIETIIMKSHDEDEYYELLRQLLWAFKMKMSIMDYCNNYYELSRWRWVLWVIETIIKGRLWCRHN